MDRSLWKRLQGQFPLGVISYRPHSSPKWDSFADDCNDPKRRNDDDNDDGTGRIEAREHGRALMAPVWESNHMWTTANLLPVSSALVFR